MTPPEKRNIAHRHRQKAPAQRAKKDARKLPRPENTTP